MSLGPLGRPLSGDILDTGFGEALAEFSAGGSDEWGSTSFFFLSGSFADEDNFGVGVSNWGAGQGSNLLDDIRSSPLVPRYTKRAVGSLCEAGVKL